MRLRSVTVGEAVGELLVNILPIGLWRRCSSLLCLHSCFL